MKKVTLVASGLLLGMLAVCKLASPAADAPAASGPPGRTAPLEVPGRTRCMIARRGIIASAIPRPVVEVLVHPGDRVTKGQPLIKLFDLEPQAKLRAREHELRSIEARAQASRRILDYAEKTQHTGAIPQTTYNEMRGTALSNEAQALAARAELSLAQSELKLYTVTAPIDGEVAWLDVSPGTVSWPGSLIWGEVVDLRELDVRCDLSPVQAEQVTVGRSAEVRLDGTAEAAGTGKVVFVGKVADRNSGLVPVVVRVDNARGRLRAEVVVNVRFQPARAD
jgi:RND family efflux transporter MFP subunit